MFRVTFVEPEKAVPSQGVYSVSEIIRVGDMGVALSLRIAQEGYYHHRR